MNIQDLKILLPRDWSDKIRKFQKIMKMLQTFWEKFMILFV